MMRTEKQIPRAVIALACTTIQLCLGTVYAWSFFQSLLINELDWTFTESAWAFSLAIFSLGVSAAWAGSALPKVGPKKLAVMGSTMFATGYFIASFALSINSIPLFYMGYGIIGGAGIGLGYVTPVATVAKWFPDRKGLMTGIVVMGFGVGAFVMSKGLAPFLLVQLDGDLANVFLWLGIIFAVVMIPASLLLSNPPAVQIEQIEQEKQVVSVQKSTLEKEKDKVDPKKDDALGPCLKSPQFIMMWIVFFCNIAAGISIISFQSPLLQEVWGVAEPDLEPKRLAEFGATLIAVSSLCNGAGRLFWGLLSDRIGRVRVFRIILASQMIVFGVLMTERNPWIFSMV